MQINRELMDRLVQQFKRDVEAAGADTILLAIGGPGEREDERTSTAMLIGSTLDAMQEFDRYLRVLPTDLRNAILAAAVGVLRAPPTKDEEAAMAEALTNAQDAASDASGLGAAAAAAEACGSGCGCQRGAQ